VLFASMAAPFFSRENFKTFSPIKPAVSDEVYTVEGFIPVEGPSTPMLVRAAIQCNVPAIKRIISRNESMNQQLKDDPHLV
ncbi:MAG: hypothetical protein ACO20W_02595, partial [Anaerohalosphaeraceae bacterium]